MPACFWNVSIQAGSCIPLACSPSLLNPNWSDSHFSHEVCLSQAHPFARMPNNKLFIPWWLHKEALLNDTCRPRTLLAVVFDSVSNRILSTIYDNPLESIIFSAVHPVFSICEAFVTEVVPCKPLQGATHVVTMRCFSVRLLVRLCTPPQTRNIISVQLTRFWAICFLQFFFHSCFWHDWMFHAILTNFSDSGQNPPEKILMQIYSLQALFLHPTVGEARHNTMLPSILVSSLSHFQKWNLNVETRQKSWRCWNSCHAVSSKGKCPISLCLSWNFSWLFGTSSQALEAIAVKQWPRVFSWETIVFCFSSMPKPKHGHKSSSQIYRALVCDAQKNLSQIKKCIAQSAQHMWCCPDFQRFLLWLEIFVWIPVPSLHDTNHVPWLLKHNIHICPFQTLSSFVSKSKWSMTALAR